MEITKQKNESSRIEYGSAVLQRILVLQNKTWKIFRLIEDKYLICLKKKEQVENIMKKPSQLTK